MHNSTLVQPQIGFFMYSRAPNKTPKGTGYGPNKTRFDNQRKGNKNL